MKFSSLLAVSALVGRHLETDKINWMDAVLTAVITKNEVLDKDGDIRKLIEGKNDREIEELRDYLDQELRERNVNPEPVAEYLNEVRESRKGYRDPIAEFCRGFRRGWKG